jgi:Mg-chelatase subunit ChlD
VAAAPAITPVLTDIAGHWAATHPVIDGACPTVVVKQTNAANEESLLEKSNVTVPDIWIPDSAQWVQRLRTDTAGVDSPVQSAWYYPAIASSPLVLAVAPGAADALSGVAAKGWPATLADTSSVRMVDPKANTEGLLALLTTQSLVAGPAANPSRALVSTLVDMAKSVLNGPASGFLALAQKREGAAAFPASEQEVFSANADAGSAGNASATAVYPSGKTLSLDYPVVQFAPPGGDPAQRDAAVAFVNQLTQGYAQQRLRSAGFRDASGAPLTGADPAVGVSDTAVKQLTIPGPGRVADALRVWTAAGRSNRTLAIIDLSGSMSESTGGGQSKIQFAADAERAAVDFFPDTSSLGLWGFANTSQELVPLGPLDASIGGVTRREALATAAASLPSRTGGNTALYQTTLDAYETVRSGYDPAAVNSVVVVTDGANTVNSGVTLDALLGRLRSETDTARPLPIITIAVGGDADVATLKQISAASGGTEYTVDQPSDIRAAYLDAIIKTE